MLRSLVNWLASLRRGDARYEEIVAEAITTTDATATPWTAIEIVPDTATAGSIVVRYVLTARQADGSNLYSITSEASWSWGAGGAITRRSVSGGLGTSSANTFGTPRPSHSFDTNNVRPTIAGKAGTTIVWNCNYRILAHNG